MINKKGQALIEFILIMPVFIIIIMGIFDFGNILYKRYQLENNLEYIVDLYSHGEYTDIDEYVNNNKLDLTTVEKKNYKVFVLTTKININTPFINIILGKEYKIETTKIVYEDNYE